MIFGTILTCRRCLGGANDKIEQFVWVWKLLGRLAAEKNATWWILMKWLTKRTNFEINYYILVLFTMLTLVMIFTKGKIQVCLCFRWRYSCCKESWIPTILGSWYEIEPIFHSFMRYLWVGNRSLHSVCSLCSAYKDLRKTFKTSCSNLVSSHILILVVSVFFRRLILCKLTRKLLLFLQIMLKYFRRAILYDGKNKSSLNQRSRLHIFKKSSNISL